MEGLHLFAYFISFHTIFSLPPEIEVGDQRGPLAHIPFHPITLASSATVTLTLNLNKY